MSHPDPLRLRPLPRPGRPQRERRLRRSNHAAEALELALSASACRGGLTAVVLSDDRGMLVAASACDLDPVPVAAVAPIVGRGRARAHVRTPKGPLPLGVEPVDVGSERLYVAAIGGPHRARRLEARRSAAAARRILA